MKLVHSAAVKLTLWYLAIIMGLSLIFSFSLYRISTFELGRGFRRQALFFNQLRPAPRLLPLPPNLERERLASLEEGRDRLRNDLVIFNLAVLVLGGAASYLLARWTLQPIEDAMEGQNRFTADASHELRTPLTAMQTEIEVALRDSRLSKQAAVDLLRSNLEEVAKLRSLSDGLLRLASGDGRELPQQQLELRSVARQAIERVAPLAKSKQIQLTDKVAVLPVIGDAPSLAELITILLDNAIKYSPAKTAVKVTGQRQGKWAQLTVSDQGPGIKASDLPRIFDRFFRADPARSRHRVDGHGLGLSIARQIAGWHGGSLEAHSRPGQGAAFVLKLPLAEDKNPG